MERGGKYSRNDIEIKGKEKLSKKKVKEGNFQK